MAIEQGAEVGERLVGHVALPRWLAKARTLLPQREKMPRGRLLVSGWFLGSAPDCALPNVFDCQLRKGRSAAERADIASAFGSTWWRSALPGRGAAPAGGLEEPANAVFCVTSPPPAAP